MPPKLKTETANVKVMVRVRPFNAREEAYSASRGKEMRPVLNVSGGRVALVDPADPTTEREAFEYDHVFWSVAGHENPNGFSEQEDVYNETGKKMLSSALDGYNCCIFAYGQTGSGKTHTMLGSPTSRGVSYLLINDLFKHINLTKQEDPATMFTVEVSFMEIYNEQVRDLFNKKAKAGEFKEIKIREDPVSGIYVQGLIRVPVTSAEECEKEMEKGVNERALAETLMNATSSRSHAICQIKILQANASTGLRRNSILNLVDLAGSERLKMSGVEGVAAKEAKNINLSLSTLRKVFDTLIANSKKRNPKTHELPPFRESTLTWVLRESLGGNSKTMMIAAVSPHEENMEDTSNTLRYALKAKSIVCKVICNEQPSAKMVENLKDQVANLRSQLAEQTTGLTEDARIELEERYEEEIKTSQKALEDAQQVEQQMQEVQVTLEAEVEKLETEKNEMHHHLNNQKKLKFAAAFRSAFAIKKEKGEVSLVKVELQELHVSFNELKIKARQLEFENRDLHKSLEDKQTAFTRDYVTVQRQLESYRQNTVRSDADLLDTQIKRKELEFQKSTLEQQLQRQEGICVSLQKEVHKLAAENEGLKRNNTISDTTVKSQLEEALLANSELERKKNAYKKQLSITQAKLDADAVIIQRLRDDKRRYQGNVNAGMTAQRAAEIAVETVGRRFVEESPPKGSKEERRGASVSQPSAAGGTDSVRELLGSLQDFRAESEDWQLRRLGSGSPRQRGDAATPGGGGGAAGTPSVSSPFAWRQSSVSSSPARARLASLSPVGNLGRR